MPEPATEMLYMPSVEDCYRREFDARVVKRGDDYVVLDRTLFYPTGGGQDYDQGALRWKEGQGNVLRVEKKGIVKHHLDSIPGDGAEVHGVLDWERRYAHMRYHTAQHVVSGLVYDMFHGARTVGNQLYTDRARVDFKPVAFTDEDLARIEEEANRLLDQKLGVRIYNEARASLVARVKPERANLDLVPQHIPELRVIDIGHFDICPCGGTHVRSTAELGRVKVTGRENKGSQITRLSFVLEGGKS